MRCFAERVLRLGGCLLLCWGMVGCGPSLTPPLSSGGGSSSGSASVPDKPVAAPAPPVKTPPEAPAVVASPPAPSQKPAEPAPKPADAAPVTATKSPAPPAGKGKDVPPADGEVKLLVKEKTFKPEGNALRVSYDDIDLIKVLNLKKPDPNVVELMPGWLKALEGKRVRMRGFMYPPFQQEGISHFVFCRDTGACCFGPNPVVYYMIDVRLKPGMTTTYIENRPFDVEGTFRIQTAVLEGTKEVYELYHLDQATVIRK